MNRKVKQPDEDCKRKMEDQFFSTFFNVVAINSNQSTLQPAKLKHFYNCRNLKRDLFFAVAMLLLVP